MRIPTEPNSTVDVLVICSEHGFMEQNVIRYVYQCANCQAIITHEDLIRLVPGYSREHPDENPVSVVVNTKPRLKTK